MKSNIGMRTIEYICWAFCGLCAVAIGREVILKTVGILGWGIPDWAAWVQAIGSIAAIVGAFKVASLQMHEQRNAEQRKSAEEALKLAEFADHVIAHAATTSKLLLKSMQVRRHRAQFHYHEEARINAAVKTLQILMEKPLPTDMAKVVMLTHLTILELDNQARRAEMQAAEFDNSSDRFRQFEGRMYDYFETIKSKSSLALSAAALAPLS